MSGASNSEPAGSNDHFVDRSGQVVQATGRLKERSHARRSAHNVYLLSKNVPFDSLNTFSY